MTDILQHLQQARTRISTVMWVRTENAVAQNITVDASRPTLTVGRIFSSDGAVARVGSTVTIVLTTSESLVASEEGCVVNGVSGLPVWWW